MDCIPTRLRSQWMPFRTTEIVYCLTPAEHLKTVLREGLVPRTDYYAELPAIILMYSKDPTYHSVHKFMVAGFRKQRIKVVRVHIKTNVQLYRSLFPNRTYQLMALDPIPAEDIQAYERL